VSHGPLFGYKKEAPSLRVDEEKIKKKKRNLQLSDAEIPHPHYQHRHYWGGTRGERGSGGTRGVGNIGGDSSSWTSLFTQPDQRWKKPLA